MSAETPRGPAPATDRVVALVQLSRWYEHDAATLREHVDVILTEFDADTVHGLSEYLNELHAAIGE